MKAARRWGVTAACAFAWLGCDPGIHVNAHVTAADECAPHGDASRPTAPVEGAVVKLHCDDADRILGRTNTDGRFSFAELGPLTADCVLTVSKPGYLPRTYRVGDACATGLVSGHCPFVSLEPVLRRESAERPAAAR